MWTLSPLEKKNLMTRVHATTFSMFFSALKDEAARQSYVLFVICGLFLACHILRLVLAIHELVKQQQLIHPSNKNSLRGQL